MEILPLETYIASILSNNPSSPIMMDESSIFTVLSGITQQHILSYDELIEANISNISLYDIPEDKKEFNIETVRRCIVDIELRPYTGKHIYILRHFATATQQAQNALLKILEECPPYAVIILEIENQNSVLETIQSRVLNFVTHQPGNIIYSISNEITEYYKNHNYTKLSQILYNLKCSSEEALIILQGVYPYLSGTDIDRCDEAIESLSSTHENPRGILDIFFL